MKTVKILASVLALTASFSSLANVKCPQANVEMVISTSDKVYIQLSMQARQVLGYATDDDIQMKTLIAKRAKTAGKKVELSFKNGQDETC